MCLMAPARVVATDGIICEVEVGGRVDKASMMLEPDLVVGDWVLVNSGTVVRKLDDDQAAEMARAFGILYGLTDEDGRPLPEAGETLPEADEMVAETDEPPLADESPLAEGAVNAEGSG
jgi:hydrogenase assembly chaperone HypC/HupF